MSCHVVRLLFLPMAVVLFSSQVPVLVLTGDATRTASKRRETVVTVLGHHCTSQRGQAYT